MHIKAKWEYFTKLLKIGKGKKNYYVSNSVALWEENKLLVNNLYIKALFYKIILLYYIKL